MRRHLFIRIINIVEQHDDYFVQKRNVVGAATFKIRTKKKTIRHYCPRNKSTKRQHLGHGDSATPACTTESRHWRTQMA
jgi:hypothetical protein